MTAILFLSTLLALSVMFAVAWRREAYRNERIAQQWRQRYTKAVRERQIW